MLRIALPSKGRLAEDARTLFADAGLEVRSPGNRALVASLGGEFEAIFVRAQDIPEFVADGAADAGITGLDLIRESERELDELLDLEFGACRLVVAARAESGVTSLATLTGVPRVATVFPRLTRHFFEKAGREVIVVPVSGAAEIAPHLGIADIIVDLTSSGSTMRVHDLREIAMVMESSARLITAVRPGGSAQGRASIGVGAPERSSTSGARDAASDDRACAISELAAALESVIRARGKRYVMANVPRNALDRVKRVLPGLNGPTVIDLLNGGTHVAVHAVVPQSSIYRTIADLKMLGGEGILVTRIERLMP
jgi:ATP phosphoribosyltransferase